MGVRFDPSRLSPEEEAENADAAARARASRDIPEPPSVPAPKFKAPPVPTEPKPAPPPGPRPTTERPQRPDYVPMGPYRPTPWDIAHITTLSLILPPSPSFLPVWKNA